MILATLAAGSGAGVSAYRRADAVVPLPSPEPLDVFARFFDPTPTPIVTTASWHKVAVVVPRWQLLVDHRLWLRMHFEDWDRLPGQLRAEGLGHLLDRYGALVADRQAWTSMQAIDWDRVPQPVRAMAFTGMIEHWVAEYRVGGAYGLDLADVLPTVKAVAMSESWFDHRASPSMPTDRSTSGSAARPTLPAGRCGGGTRRGASSSCWRTRTMPTPGWPRVGPCSGSR
jgi:hypothetical protein